MTMYEHYESKVIDAIEMALGASWWDNLSEEAQDRIHDNLFSALNDDVAQPQQGEGVNCSAQGGPTNNARDEIAAAEKLCKLYFDIAASCIGEEAVRRRVVAATSPVA